MRLQLAVALVAVALVACSSSGGVDRRCSVVGCPDGFSCDPSTDLCVAAGGVDARAASPPDAQIVFSVPDAAPPPPIDAALATPPDTTLTAQPPALGNQATVSFAFTATVTPATFECSLDGAAFATCTSPHAVTVADGSHGFAVRAIANGLTDATPAGASFTTDTVAPETTIVSGPSGTTNDNEAVWGFTASEPATFVCSLDGQPARPCSSPYVYNDFVAGPHTLTVTATDLAGNTDPTPATVSIDVELPLANTTIVSATTSGTHAVFAFVADVTGATFECSLDGAPFTACVSPVTYDGLAEGEHEFDVRAVIANGVDPTPAAAHWLVDTIGPTALITAGPAAGATACPSVSFAYTTRPLEDDATFECALVAGPGPAANNEYTACPTSGQTYSGLVDATAYTFAVRAVDPTGNRGAPDQVGFSVDGRGPSVTITSPTATSSASTNVAVAFSYPAEADASATCTLDGANVIHDCASGQTFTGLAPGEHTVRVEVADACGNVGAASVTFDVVAATTVAISQPAAGATTCRTGTVSYSTGSSATVACTLDGAAVACDTTGFYTFTGLSGGGHDFTVTGFDTHGGQVGTAPVHFIVDAQGPTMQIAAPSDALAGGDGHTCSSGELSFACATDCPTSMVECQIDSGDFHRCDDGALSFVGLGDGQHLLRVRGYDSCDNVGPTATRSWTIGGTDDQRLWRTIEPVQQLVNRVANEALAPRVVSNASGQALMVWLQDNAAGNPGRNLYAAERSAAGVWSAPRALTPPGGLPISTPAVALNNDGRAVVAWAQNAVLPASGRANRLYLAERDEAGAWTTPGTTADFVSMDAAANDAGMPSVALNNHGRAVLTWVQSQNNEDAQLYKAERSEAGVWTFPASLADHLSPDCTGPGLPRRVAWLNQWDTRPPNVVINNAGQAIIAWEQSGAIYEVERGADGVWSGATDGGDTLADAGASPALAINGRGEAIIVWTDTATGALAHADRDAGGQWSAAIDLDGLLPFNELYSVALNDAGQVVIPFSTADGTIAAATRDGGAWSTTPVETQDNSEYAPPPYITTGVYGAMSVALNASGQAIIAWSELYPAVFRYQTHMAERDALGVWGDSRRLTYGYPEPDPEDDVGIGTNPSLSPNLTAIALDDSGRAVAVWLEDHAAAIRGDTNQVFRAERDSDGEWHYPGDYYKSAVLAHPATNEVTASLQFEGISGQAYQIAANQAGQAVAVWTQSDGVNFQLYVAERDATGAWTGPSDPSDHISVTPGVDASTPWVAINDVGAALVVWLEGSVVAGTSHLIIKERDAGGVWGPAYEVDSSILPQHYSHAAINHSGQAIVANGTYILERDSDGVWTTYDGPLRGEAPKVGLDDAGQAIVADWGEATPPDDCRALGGVGLAPVQFVGIDVLERDIHGAWAAPHRLTDPDELIKLCTLYGDVSREGLQLAMNQSGQVIVTFQAYGAMYHADRTAAGVWSPLVTPTDRLGHGDGCGVTSSLSMNDAGEAVVAWEEREQTFFGTLRTTSRAWRDHDGVWTSPAISDDDYYLSTPVSRNASQPHVALNASGAALIEWRENHGLGEAGAVYAVQRADGGAAWTTAAPAPWVSTRGEDSAQFYDTMKPILLDSGDAIVGVDEPRLGMSVIEYR